MAAIFSPSPAASGTRSNSANGATTSRRTCACSRKPTRPLPRRDEAPVPVNVYALTCGHLTGELGHLMEGGEGRIRLPIPAYLIEHPNGTALFEHGMHPE